MPFDFYAKYALLTYAQCGSLDPWAVVELLSGLGAECIIGRENHADGGIHLHVFVSFGRKYRSRRVDVFDVGGFHPNISPSKGTPEEGYDYAIKDGDVVAGGLSREELLPSGNRVGSVAARWSEITSADSVDEFWRLVFELDPQRGACSWPSLNKFAEWKFAPKPTCYEPPTGIEYDEGLLDGRYDWLQQSGIGLEEPLLGMCCVDVLPVPSAAVARAP